MKRILILGGSGFIGNALYKELLPYYDTYATYRTSHALYDNNSKFFQIDLEQEDLGLLLEQLRPAIIVSALRGPFEAQLVAHQRVISYLKDHRSTRLIFLSSANVFDAFSNYPSYEYDKTLSQSIYGRFKIKIENALLRLKPDQYVIARVPMVYGAQSPRIQELKRQLKSQEAIEVFSNVVVNATNDSKLTQQLHYIINRNSCGIFHLGSQDLIHHNDLVQDFCEALGEPRPLLKNVYDSNFDRFLAVLPKDHLLPENLQFGVQEVIRSTVAP